jgi:hypothetical protein
MNFFLWVFPNIKSKCNSMFTNYSSSKPQRASSLHSHLLFMRGIQKGLTVEKRPTSHLETCRSRTHYFTPDVTA